MTERDHGVFIGQEKDYFRHGDLLLQQLTNGRNQVAGRQAATEAALAAPGRSAQPHARQLAS